MKIVIRLSSAERREIHKWIRHLAIHLHMKPSVKFTIEGYDELKDWPNKGILN